MRTLTAVGVAAAALLPASITADRLFDGSAVPARVDAPMFEVDMLWPQPLPNGWLLGSAVGIGVDSRDNIYVLHRTDSFNQRTEVGASTTPPTGECCAPAPHVLVFRPDGALHAHWGGPGDGYAWPAQSHRLSIDARDNVWIAGIGDEDTHLLKFSADGRFQAQFGRAATGTVAGAAVSRPAAEAFNRPADVTVDAANAEAYVADGYGARRVAVIDMNTGALKRQWGAYGEAPRKADLPAYDPAAPPVRDFSVVHCAEPSRDGHVYVCDRGNNRIQVFRRDGTFVKEKAIMTRTLGEGAVWDIAFSHDPAQRFLYVADGMNMRVHILDRESLEVLTSFGAGGRQPGQFFAIHSLAVDSQGNLYTAESLEGKRVQKFVFKGIGLVTSTDQGVLWPKR